MDVLDIIPEELWVETLSLLNCRDLLRVCLSTKSLNNICNKNNISEIIKYTGFPRVTGHCGYIDISEYHNNLKFSNVDVILNMLHNSNYELIRGDLVLFNKNKNKEMFYIFDGEKLLQFKYNFDGEKLLQFKYNFNGELYCLPKEFTVINNGIPYDYWNKNDSYKGLEYDRFAWFNISEVKDQCLNNLRYDDDLKHPITTFTYDKMDYVLVYRFFRRQLTIDNYKKLFNTTNLLLLDFDINYNRKINYLLIVNM